MNRVVSTSSNIEYSIDEFIGYEESDRDVNFEVNSQQCSTLQCSAVQYTAVQCSAVKCSLFSTTSITFIVCVRNHIITLPE